MLAAAQELFFSVATPVALDTLTYRGESDEKLSSDASGEKELAAFVKYDPSLNVTATAAVAAVTPLVPASEYMVGMPAIPEPLYVSATLCTLTLVADT